MRTKYLKRLIVVLLVISFCISSQVDANIPFAKIDLTPYDKQWKVRIVDVDAKRIIVASNGYGQKSTIDVLDAKTGRIIKHTTPITMIDAWRVALSSDGKTIAAIEDTYLVAGKLHRPDKVYFIDSKTLKLKKVIDFNKKYYAMGIIFANTITNNVIVTGCSSKLNPSIRYVNYLNGKIGQESKK